MTTPSALAAELAALLADQSFDATIHLKGEQWRAILAALTPELPGDVGELVERLARRAYQHERWLEPLGAIDVPCDVDDYGAVEYFVNPDGPQAAVLIRQQAAQIDQLERNAKACGHTIDTLVKYQGELKEQIASLTAERDLWAGRAGEYANAEMSGSLTAREDGLRAALQPFAAKAGLFHDDDAPDYCPDWSPFIPASAYRAARLALTKGSGDEG